MELQGPGGGRGSSKGADPAIQAGRRQLPQVGPLWREGQPSRFALSRHGRGEKTEPTPNQGWQDGAPPCDRKTAEQQVGREDGAPGGMSASEPPMEMQLRWPVIGLGGPGGGPRMEIRFQTDCIALSLSEATVGERAPRREPRAPQH